MKIINIDNQTIYLNEYSSVTYQIKISIGNNDLLVKYNNTSSLYNENCYIDSPIKPINNTMWYVI